MDASNSSNEEMDNTLPEWHEPFPEPQTIPSGWDMSRILSNAESNSTLGTESSTEE
ncbi:MAG: hypothetical protein ABIF04_01285 [Chloroflexota bacterium]